MIRFSEFRLRCFSYQKRKYFQETIGCVVGGGGGGIFNFLSEVNL